MKHTYDARKDILYIRLRDNTGPVHTTVTPGFDVFLDLDVRGCLIGIEITNATKRCGEWVRELDV